MSIFLTGLRNVLLFNAALSLAAFRVAGIVGSSAVGGLEEPK
jgi:hypothetical protein